MLKTACRGRRVLTWSLVLAFAVAGRAAAQEYAALDGATSIKAVFDTRLGNPARLARYLDLMRDTLADPSVRAVSESPDFKVVFLGPAVRFISRNREGVSVDEAKVMEEIKETVSAMARDGITLEVCRIALASAEVDPDSVLPEISPVGNGWISLIGYQASGYSLIALY